MNLSYYGFNLEYIALFTSNEIHIKFLSLKVNNLHKICCTYKQENQQRVLGSSLPITGGGDTMTKFEKIYLIICILTLVVQIIDLCK